jgi:hypothetical protein
MPRKSRAVEAAAQTPPLQEVKDQSEYHTLVISNVPRTIYNSLLLKTFKEAATGKGRPSVSQAAREVLEDWNRREGPALMITQSK